MKTATIIIRVDESLKQKLQQLADNDKRKLSDFIRLQLENITENIK